MTTWSEDNWFVRLDRLLEKERNITPRSLLSTNISDFPELYRDLFNREPKKFADYYIPNLKDFEWMFRLDDMVCREKCEKTFETFIETIFPYLVRDFVKMIPARIERRRQAAYNRVKDTEEYRTIRKVEAEYLKTINAYTTNPKKKAELDAAYEIMAQKFSFSDKSEVSSPHLDPVDPGPSTKNLPGREKAFFIYAVQHLGISDLDTQKLRKKLDSLSDDTFIDIHESSSDCIESALTEALMSYFEDIKNSVLDKGCKKIDRRSHDNDKDLLKYTLFDLRGEEICINTRCYTIKDRLGSDRAGDLKNKYKCDAFVAGLPSLGDSNSTHAERDYCSLRQSIAFGMLLKDPKTEIAKRFTETLPEDIFTGMLEHAVYLNDDASFQNPDDEFRNDMRVDVTEFRKEHLKDLPTMVVRPAEYTSHLFSNKLGGQLVLHDKSLFLKVGRTLISPERARGIWKNYYKADVLYLYDHPSKVYSDGTPAKIYFPVQVKSVASDISRKLELFSGESAHLGRMSASAELLRSLVDPEKEGLTIAERDNLAAQVISLLVYGDYLLTINTWDRWCYLPLTEDLYKRHYNFEKTKGVQGNPGKEFTDEFTIPLSTPSGKIDVDVKMRVADRVGKNTPGDIHVEIFPGGIRL